MRKFILSAALMLWAGLAHGQGVTVQQLPVDPNPVTTVTTLWCGDGIPPHTYQCPAITVASSILGQNNTWTGSNIFNGTVSLNGVTLGSAATQNIGVSGANVPLLSTANTWGAQQTFLASTTGGASINIPQGVAPSSPNNGDCWTTSVGMYCFINGGTQGPYGVSGSGVTSFNTRSGAITLTSGDVTTALTYTPLDIAGSNSMTAKLTLLTGGTSAASMSCPQGAAPTSPVNGDVWCTSAGMFGRFAGSTIGPFGGGSSGVSSFNTRSGAVTLTSSDVTTALTFTPLKPSNNLSDVSSATTALTNLGGATLASPTFTGTPAAPTAGAGTNTTQIATTAYVVANAAKIGGPTQNGQCTYTLVLADAGKQIYCNTASTHTLTVPANSSVAFATTTYINLINDCSAGNLTISITTDTMVWFPSGGTGTRTLAACGDATLKKVGTTRWVIEGTGLSANDNLEWDRAA